MKKLLFYLNSDLSDLYTTKSGTVENCNDLITPGFYPHTVTPGSPNGPGYYAYLLNLYYISGNTKNITQVAFGYNVGAISIRNRNNDTWSAWTKF